jgi:hypothetical protein
LSQMVQLKRRMAVGRGLFLRGGIVAVVGGEGER